MAQQAGMIMATLDPWQQKAAHSLPGSWASLYIVGTDRQTLVLPMTKYHLNDLLNKSQWGKRVHVCGYG